MNQYYIVELRNDVNTRVQTLKKKSTTHYISDLFMQFIISLTKINFSKENIIIFFIQIAYYTHMGQAITIQKHANI